MTDSGKSIQEKPNQTTWSPAVTKKATVINGKVKLEDSDLGEFVGRQ